MRFTITKQNLMEGLSGVLQVVPAKTTLPILSNILINAEASQIVISATDLNTGIQTAIKAEVHEPGAITVPARRFHEVVRELPEQPIDFAVEDYQITVQCGRGVFRLIGVDAEEFPAFPKVDEERKIEVKSEQFFRLVSKTAFAVSTDEMRAMLTGVYWKVESEHMTMVATDGHRLVKIQHDLESEASLPDDEPVGLIVPPKALTQAQRLLSHTETMTIHLSENFILFQGKDGLVYSRLIEGDYVNYDQVIPYANDKTIRLNRMELLKAARRVAVLADQLTHQITFKLQPNLIILSVNTPELGEAKEELAVEYNHEDMEIGYNALYLIDILNHVDDEYVLFKLSSPVTAGLVLPEEPREGEDHVSLIMPIRLSD